VVRVAAGSVYDADAVAAAWRGLKLKPEILTAKDTRPHEGKLGYWCSLVSNSNGDARDASLRLKNGSARDDAI